MPKRSSNTRDSEPPRGSGDEPVKDLHAVELGRRGGRIGGRARAESLTPEQRSDIARNAAAKRWKRRANDAIDKEIKPERKRDRLSQRLREAFAAGAEAHSHQVTGRGLTDDELDDVLRRYPGHDNDGQGPA